MEKVDERRTLEQTIKIIARLEKYYISIIEHNGKFWEPLLEATSKILNILESDKPDPKKIRSIIESTSTGDDGTAWYEVRTMIWLWEDADRRENHDDSNEMTSQLGSTDMTAKEWAERSDYELVREARENPTTAHFLPHNIKKRYVNHWQTLPLKTRKDPGRLAYGTEPEEAGRYSSYLFDGWLSDREWRNATRCVTRRHRFLLDRNGITPTVGPCHTATQEMINLLLASIERESHYFDCRL